MLILFILWFYTVGHYGHHPFMCSFHTKILSQKNRKLKKNTLEYFQKLPGPSHVQFVIVVKQFATALTHLHFSTILINEHIFCLLYN